MAGAHTLAETERQVNLRLKNMSIDFKALAVTSNLFRAATAVRNHLENTVLAPHGLSWTAFVVMWVVWIWEPIETRDIAAEGGFSKATLTGVLSTLEARGLAVRYKSVDDRRLVLVKLTPEGRALMRELFPEFNQQEQRVSGMLSPAAQDEVAESLRLITTNIEKLR